MRATSGEKSANMSPNMKNQIEKSFSKMVQRIVSAGGQQVKLGIDLHARDGVVCVQVDGSLPQRPMRLAHCKVVLLAKELLAAKLSVYACYEAGPCGYGLYRRLSEIGATAYVVAPVSLKDGRKQKTDGLDARGLVDQLDRYLHGNKKAFTVIRVPTESEERKRAEGRFREQLKESRKQWEARGRSLLLGQGFHVTGKWWGPRRWANLAAELPQWLVEQLEVMREVLLELDTKEKAAKEKLVARVKEPLPVGIGALTWALLTQEICNWRRFANRRQVSGFVGLCPGVHQSGTSRRELSINKHGNPRIRALLIETVWRLVRWQPNYPPVRQLLEGIVGGRARRKLAVAAARKLAVDLWRLATGQTTPEKLGLRMPEARTS
jgi:transposase